MTTSGGTAGYLPVFSAACDIENPLSGFPIFQSQSGSNAGDVGIGTASPSHTLDVQSSSTSTPTELRVSNTATSGNSFGIIATTANNGIITQFVASSPSMGTPEGILGTFSNHPLAMQTDNTTRMLFDTSGNVMITGPSPWIDVKAPAYAAYGDTQTGTDGVMTATTSSGSSTITSASNPFSCSPTCAMSPDVGKAFSINNSPEPPPLLPVPTDGSTGTITPGAVIYYRLTLINTGGEGTASQEGFFTVDSAGSIKIPAPTGDSSTMAWNVYAAESDQEPAAGIAVDNSTCSSAGLCRTSGTTVTVTTTSAHDFEPGQTILITGVSSCSGVGQGFEGAFVVATVPSSTKLTYSQLGTSMQHCGGGTVGIYDSASGYEELQPTTGCSATTTVTLTNKVGGGSITGCSITPSTTTWTATSSITRSGTATPPPPSVSIGTINTVNSTGSVTVSFSAPNSTAEGSAFAWGHNDTSAIQSALNSAGCNPSAPPKFGCKVFFPPGSYWVQTSSLNIANTQPFVYLAGAGAANSKELGSGLVGMISATSEIVTPDAIYPLVVGTSGGNAFNAGPKISNLGFRDISGVGNAKGGIQFLGVAHAFLGNLSFIDFANGAGINFDTTNATMQFTQFNYILDPTIQNTRTPILFTGATASSNYIEGGNLIGSQLGGGACIDIQPDGASTKNTGHNYIHYPQCNYFPTGMSLYDQNSDEIFFHAENSFMQPTGQGAPIGSPGAGTGIVLDGIASGCISDQISETSFTSFATGVGVSGNCSQTALISPTFSSVSVPISDSGVSTQTVGAPPAVQALTFSGGGNSMVQYFTPVSGTGLAANQLVCFSATVNFAVKNCPSSATNFVGVAILTPTSGAPLAIQIAGTATVSLDNSPMVAVTGGDYICSGSSGKGHENMGGPCNAGQQVGIAAAGSASVAVSTATVFLQKN
jgi:hypothetical protein